MAKKIPVSFRETNKDMKLYSFLMALEEGERSSWIKDQLRNIIEKENNLNK